MKQAPQRLANAELAIMNLLWKTERLTARLIREQLYPDASKAQHGTVQRLLQRLEEKGYVTRDRSLPVHFFSATTSRQSYACTQIEVLADKLTDGSLAPLITHFIETRKLSHDDIEKFRALLDDHQDEGD